MKRALLEAMKGKPVTQEQLRAILKDQKPHEFFIYLYSGGRSSKSIQRVKDNKYFIMNYIDGTDAVVSFEDLVKPDGLHIGTALQNKTLILEY